MRIDIMTLFPDSMRRVLGESIIGRAAAKGIIEINCVQIRDYTDNKQCQVDDYPYGGGWGCVMMAQPLKACLDDIISKSPEGLRRRVIYMSAQGEPYDQEQAKRLLRDYDQLVLVCGHYEGVDERFIEECVDEELSMGDFVLTGGEIAAMAVADSVCRMVPGVLADEECFTGESHWDGLLEYPQYTRPETWRGRKTPEVLLNGNHAHITRWRRKQSLTRTMERRPDMFEKLDFSNKADKDLLDEIITERGGKSPEPVFDYRKATKDDIDGILDVVSDAREFLRENGVDQWQDGYPNAESFIIDISADECWVFTDGGKIAGMITISMRGERMYERIDSGSWLTGPSEYGTIHRSAVKREYRGTRLAREMIALAEDLSLGSGKRSVRVDTHRDNKPMLGLLRKCGYAERGIVYMLRKSEGHDPERVAFEKILEY